MVLSDDCHMKSTDRSEEFIRLYFPGFMPISGATCAVRIDLRNGARHMTMVAQLRGAGGKASLVPYARSMIEPLARKCIIARPVSSRVTCRSIGIGTLGPRVDLRMSRRSAKTLTTI